MDISGVLTVPVAIQIINQLFLTGLFIFLILIVFLVVADIGFFICYECRSEYKFQYCSNQGGAKNNCPGLGIIPDCIPYKGCN